MFAIFSQNLEKAAEDLEMEASGEVVLSELDIMYTKEEYDRLQQNELPLESRQANRRHDKNLRTALREKRAATNVEHKYWPDAVIPYVIDEDAVFSKHCYNHKFANIQRYLTENRHQSDQEAHIFHCWINSGS